MIILNCRVSKEQVSKAGSHGQTESLIHLARAARSLVSANKCYIKVTKVLFFFRTVRAGA